MPRTHGSWRRGIRRRSGPCFKGKNGRTAWTSGSQYSKDRDELTSHSYRVCKIMHVKTPQDHEHNVGNKTLLEGARRLGYLCKSVPQNITGTFAAHQECGASCTAGCRGRGEADDEKTGRSGKMSGERAFLDEFLRLDADADSAGPRRKVTVDILDKFDVERVVFEEGLGSGRKAVGVAGTVKAQDGTVHKAFIKANRVVVAAGTLNSPCVLLRSGLKVRSLFDGRERC